MDVGAAQGLLEVQLASSDLTGAAATLQVMQTHQPGAGTMAAEVFVRLLRGDVLSSDEVRETSRSRS